MSTVDRLMALADEYARIRGAAASWPTDSLIEKETGSRAALRAELERLFSEEQAGSHDDWCRKHYEDAPPPAADAKEPK